MAVTTVTITVNKYPVPLEGPPTLQRVQTAIPQHVLLCYGASTQAADGNQHELIASFDMPDGFVYQLTDFSVMAQGSNADMTFASISQLQVPYLYPTGEFIEQFLPCNSWGTTLQSGTTAVQRIWVPERLPGYPIQPGSTSLMTWRALSSGVPTGSMQAFVFARLLAFDQQQFSAWPIHTPTLVL